MPKISMYYMPESPPCRAVQMVASLLDIDLELKYLNLAEGEHLKGMLPTVNRLCLVPTIVLDGPDPFVLWESRAILKFLVDSFASETVREQLYPRDPKKRAKIDQMMDFDLGILYSRQGSCLRPLLQGQKIDPLNEVKFKEALDHLDMFLEKNEFVCGDQMTLADISIRAGLTFAEACVYDFVPYERVTDWMERVEHSIPQYHDINHDAMTRFTDYVNQKVLDGNKS